jgi:hypothetical protein
VAENNAWGRLPKTEVHLAKHGISAYFESQERVTGDVRRFRVPYNPCVLDGPILMEDYRGALMSVYREWLGDAETGIEKNIQNGWDRIRVQGAHPLIADLDTSGVLDFAYDKNDDALDCVVKDFVERLCALK